MLCTSLSPPKIFAHRSPKITNNGIDVGNLHYVYNLLYCSGNLEARGGQGREGWKRRYEYMEGGGERGDGAGAAGRASKIKIN